MIEIMSDTVIAISGRLFDIPYLERVLEIPQGYINKTFGNDDALIPLLKIIGTYPDILKVYESRFSPEDVEEFRKRHYVC